MDLQTRIDITPRNLIKARLQSSVLHSRNSGESKVEQQYRDTLTLLEQTPGENFKEIRQSILSNTKNHSTGHKIQQWLSKQHIPNLFGFPISLEVKEENLNKKVRTGLEQITDEAIRKPLLESALENIQRNPDSSSGQMQQRWLLAGVDRTLAGATGNEPEYLAYSEVFPFVKQWG